MKQWFDLWACGVTETEKQYNFSQTLGGRSGFFRMLWAARIKNKINNRQYNE